MTDALRQAAANAAKVMPPITAQFLAHQLTAAAHTISGTTSFEVFDRWLELANEINAYAARARRHTEHEVFLAGSTPDDAAFTRPAETQGDALTADRWLVGAGAAHRLVFQLYGPWQIDRPAAHTAKESAA